MENEELTPITVDWLSRKQAIQSLGISDAAYRQDISLLRDLNLIQHPPRTRGISAESFHTLLTFRNLARERGKLAACKALVNLKKFNEGNKNHAK